MEIISVSSKGQIVIPERVRKNLNIKQGSKLILFEKEGTILIKKEAQIAKMLEENEKKEAAGWISLAERSLKEAWDNPKDEKNWKRYL